MINCAMKPKREEWSTLTKLYFSYNLYSWYSILNYPATTLRSSTLWGWEKEASISTLNIFSILYSWHYIFRLPSDYSAVIYTVGVMEGGLEEWDYVWNRSQATNVAVEREMLMDALGQSQKPWLLWRYSLSVCLFFLILGSYYFSMHYSLFFFCKSLKSNVLASIFFLTKIHA